MAVRRVLTVPGDETKLRIKSNKVPSIDRSVAALVEDMLDTLYEYDGIGLAAPQIGVTLRLVIIHLPDEEEPRIMINPQIVKTGGQMYEDEGCLSVPGYVGQIERYANITVKALNINGQEVRHKAIDPLFAKALQHELDHLDGILYYDRLIEGEHLKPARRADDKEATSIENKPLRQTKPTVLKESYEP
ncbi:MAG: peptide deformylase [Chloroflexi bacterium]|nr:peptide deformylase [Chloroflexota bacterium]